MKVTFAERIRKASVHPIDKKSSIKAGLSTCPLTKIKQKLVSLLEKVMGNLPITKTGLNADPEDIIEKAKQNEEVQSTPFLERQIMWVNEGLEIIKEINNNNTSDRNRESGEEDEKGDIINDLASLNEEAKEDLPNLKLDPKTKPAESCFSFKNAEGVHNNLGFEIALKKKPSRKESLNSDCEKRKAIVNKIACFARKPSEKLSNLVPSQHNLKRLNSCEDVRIFERLHNLSEVSNLSTCSQKSFKDSDYFYQDPDQKSPIKLLDNPQRHQYQGVHSGNSSLDRINSSYGIMSPQLTLTEMTNPPPIPLQRWIPDEFSKKCMRCKREFDLFVRKHHCRRCGHLLCYSCCGEWVRIKDLFNSGLGSEQKKVLQNYYPKYNKMRKKTQKVRICTD